jgi:CheY-like chemotaxis protein
MASQLNGADYKILVVDDDDDNRVLMQAFLEMCGYSVVLAVNGSEAVTKSITEQPDLILMDIGLPDINGITAAKLIREKEPQLVPIIIISAYEMGTYETDIKEIVCEEYLTKPIDPAYLQTLIPRVVSGFKDGVAKN